MGPGPPPRRPVPLSRSAGKARSSQKWGQPRPPGVSVPGLEQGSGEDRWPPRHAGLGSARPWGLSFSTVGSWGESRGCLSVDGSSGSWGPHAATSPRLTPAAHPRHTCTVHLSGPGLRGSLLFRLWLGPGATMVWGKGMVFMLSQDHSGGGRGHKAGTPSPPSCAQHALRGISRLNPTQKLFLPRWPPQPFGTQGRR